MMPLDVDRHDKILIIAPHPDDECIGAGGIIALFSLQCTVIVVTDGAYADKTLRPSTMREIRKKEFYKEMKVAGVQKFFMLDQQDGTVSNSPDIFKTIEFKKYTKIFLPSQIDRHPDHTFCAIYSLKEMKKQKVSDVEIYYYEVHKPLFAPTDYIDITDVIEKKIEYIKMHRSQCALRDYASQARFLAQYRASQGKAVGKCYEVYEKTNIGSIYTKYNRKDDYLISSYRWKNTVLRNWIKNRIKKRKISAYLEKYGIKRIGIYGFGDIGQLLYEDVTDSGVEVAYFLDRKAKHFKEKDIPVLFPDKYYRGIDALILTIPSSDIKTTLKNQGYSLILPLDRILDADDLE